MMRSIPTAIVWDKQFQFQQAINAFVHRSQFAFCWQFAGQIALASSFRRRLSSRLRCGLNVGRHHLPDSLPTDDLQAEFFVNGQHPEFIRE